MVVRPLYLPTDYHDHHGQLRLVMLTVGWMPPAMSHHPGHRTGWP
jgi:hypothetical protein